MTVKQTVTEMVDRWNQLFEAGAVLTDRLGGEDQPEYRAIYTEMLQLESPLLLADAESIADIEAKWNFVIDNGLFDQYTGTLNRLLLAIFQRDVDRVGATIPEFEAEGITVTKARRKPDAGEQHAPL